jgi:hypothetical protein
MRSSMEIWVDFAVVNGLVYPNPKTQSASKAMRKASQIKGRIR